MGVGAFNLVRRSAYEKIGTYESMRLSVVDDMRLGEKVKQAGLASRVAFGEGHGHGCAGRWEPAAWCSNLTKNFFAHLRYNLGWHCWPRWGCCGCIWGRGWERRWRRDGRAPAMRLRWALC